MKKSLYLLLFLLMSLTLNAQMTKLHLKAIGGYNAHVYPQQKNNVMHGWQVGFGFRITQKRIMAETDLLFLRNNVSLILQDPDNQDQFETFDFSLRALEIPFKVGYVPIKTPFIKWYCYSGTILRFKTKGFYVENDEVIKFNPLEVGFVNPNVDFILGTQVDIGWLNLDLTYSLGMMHSLRDNTRTNSHELQLSTGILF